MNIKTLAVLTTTVLLTVGAAQAQQTHVAVANSVNATQVPRARLIDSQVRQALDGYFDLWRLSVANTAAAAFKEDAVLDYDLLIPELHAEVQGRQSIIHQVRALAQLGRNWRFNNVQILHTSYPNIYFAQYEASAERVTTGQHFEHHVVISLEFDGTRISKLREFYNPAIGEASIDP